jgi:hypothetical protein
MDELDIKIYPVEEVKEKKKKISMSKIFDIKTKKKPKKKLK